MASIAWAVRTNKPYGFGVSGKEKTRLEVILEWGDPQNWQN